jgi:heme-degrading monooxygenase HmoA
VILRVWRARVNTARIDEYRRFEAERYLPMLYKQPGFLAVLFLRQAEDHAASLTIWEDRGAVEAVESSPSYRWAVRELAGSDLLAGEQSEEVFEVEGGDLRAEMLLGALAKCRAWRCEGQRLNERAQPGDPPCPSPRFSPPPDRCSP